MHDDEDDYVLAVDLLGDVAEGEYALQWIQGYAEALAQLMTAPPHVCLLDYRLGARTGIELIQEARSLGCEVPIIFLTGQSEREFDLAAMRAGAADFLVKGRFDASTLERAIRYALERGATEAAHRRLNQELRAMQEQAQRSSQAKSALLASVSHEFRTPLNAILGYSEIVLEQCSEGRYDGLADDIRRIHDAGSHLLDLVSDFLDMTKIESGRLSLTPQRFAVADLLREVAEAVDPMIRRNSNTFAGPRTSELGEAFADATRVRQILLNLLSNAAKFTRQGAVTLSAARRPARIGDSGTHGRFIADGGECLEFCVHDTGIGMTAKQMTRLFEPFSQVDETAGRRFGGSGLGLAISRRIARMMGGDIDVTSELGRGSTFRLVLPADARMTRRLYGHESKDRLVAIEPGDHRVPVVLLLASNAELAHELREPLVRANLDVVIESDLRRGVKLARAMNPSLVVVELNIGDIATLCALGQLGRDLVHQDAELLVCIVDPSGQFGGILHGDGVVSAPLQPLALRRAVERCVPDAAWPLRLWSNSAELLHDATEIVRQMRRVVPLGDSVDAIDLHLIDLAARGAFWSFLSAGQTTQLRRSPASRTLFVAPDELNVIPVDFIDEMHTLLGQYGAPRAIFIQEVSAAIVLKLRPIEPGERRFRPL